MSARLLKELLDLKDGPEELESSAEAEELESSPQAIKVADKNSAALIFKKFLNRCPKQLGIDYRFLAG